MAEIPQALNTWMFGRAKWKTQVAATLDALGVVFVLIGIYSDATNTKIGLEATNWFLLAIVIVLWGFWKWTIAYTAKKEV